MDEKVEIRRDLLPEGDWPDTLVDEVGVAQLMFDELSAKIAAGDTLVMGAYVVGVRGGKRNLFFVQEAMNVGDPGKDVVERLLVAMIMSGAEEVVCVGESWMVRAEAKVDVEEVLRWLAEHGGLQGHPDATERLTVALHNRSGEWFAAADIYREGPVARLGVWACQHQQYAPGQGRFQNLFLKAQSFEGDKN